MKTNLISCRNICVNFGDIEALRDVSLQVSQGRVLGLLGQNGAGKSTLLRTLSGVLAPTSGEVFLNNHPATAHQLSQRTAVLFGGNTGLYEDLTAHENIHYFAKLRGMSETEANYAELRLTQRLEIQEYLDKPTGTLSTGTRQKVAIIRALIHDPQVILLDEPDAGLDFKAVRTVLEFLMMLAHEEGKAVVISSHSVGDILSTCDDIAILQNGHLTFETTVSAITENRGVEEAFDALYKLVIEGISAEMAGVKNYS